MKVQITGSAGTLDILLKWLRRNEACGDYGPIRTILRVEPGLTQEREVNAHLSRLLVSANPYWRYDAARALAESGQTEGVDHLVFNALTHHPLRRERIDRKFAYSLVPFVHLLEKRHLELLLDDLELGGNAHNCVTVSVAFGDWMIDRLLELHASGSQRCRRWAAYVLGWNRHISVKETLQEWLDEPVDLNDVSPLLPLALIDPDGHALAALSNPDHPRYLSARGEAEKRALLSSSALTLQLNSAKRFEEKIEAWDMHFATVLRHVMIFTGGALTTTHALSRPIHIYTPYAAPAYGGNAGSDFLWAYFTPEEREQIAAINRAATDELFDREGISFSELLDGRYFPVSYKLEYTGFEPEVGASDSFADDVRVIYDRTDYSLRAVQWITQPELHRAR